jgi:hypothetical protein
MNTATTWVLIASVAIVFVLSLPGWMALVRRPVPVVPAVEYQSMSHTIKELSDQLATMHGEMMKLQTRMAHMEAGINILIAQVKRLGGDPEYEPPLEEREEDRHYNQSDLLRRMSRQFNMDELADLAYQLDIQTGALGGDTVSAKARAIITYMERRGELAKLVAFCRRLRPEGRF